jgi:hypothetical protein
MVLLAQAANVSTSIYVGQSFRLKYRRLTMSSDLRTPTRDKAAMTSGNRRHPGGGSRARQAPHGLRSINDCRRAGPQRPYSPQDPLPSSRMPAADTVSRASGVVALNLMPAMPTFVPPTTFKLVGPLPSITLRSCRIPTRPGSVGLRGGGARFRR